MLPVLTGRRWLLLVPIYLVMLAGDWNFGELPRNVSGLEDRPINGPALHYMTVMKTGLFAVASAITFVPSAEIGIGLIMKPGPSIMFLVYICMVAALIAAYLIGPLIPMQRT